MSTITLDGVQYVVSPQFASVIQRDLGGLIFNMRDAEAERMSLLFLSNRRALFADDRKRLGALAHVKNVANTIRVVGAHHDPAKEWGFDGWDAVHGDAHHAECTCASLYVFDHHSAVNHFEHNRVIPTLEEHLRYGAPLREREHYEFARFVCTAHGG